MHPGHLRGVLGLGFDLVEVPRFAGVLDRQREAFVKRCFTPREQLYCEAKSNPVPFYAARFAAKEAVSKAFGTGIGAEIGLLDIEVDNHENGAPYIRLYGRGAELAKQRGVTEVLISLTHTDFMAGATVILQ